MNEKQKLANAVPNRNRMIVKAAWRDWKVRAMCKSKKNFSERLIGYLGDGFTAAQFILDILDDYDLKEWQEELWEELEYSSRQSKSYY